MQLAKEVTANVQTADQFLKISNNFKLGCLLTEQQCPRTMNLSTMAQQDIPKAVNTIKQLDIHTLEVLREKIDLLDGLYKDINETLENGGKVFICGCGATGRLALVLETLWRHQIQQIFNKTKPQDRKLQDWKQRVVAFMAGGDVALIKSIQDFEDHPQFAEQQLVQLGYQQNDLLVGSTEGGQTPWVIGAVWKATSISKRKPYILYGNTDQILSQNVKRSKQFIQSDKIYKINCNVGQMALAGSTRMQSTTILMYAIGLALLGCDWNRKTKLKDNQPWKQYATRNVDKFIEFVKKSDFSKLAPLIQYQSQLYKQDKQITYRTDPYYAMSILTDTTERSPTFSLNPFPNRYDTKSKVCWCNMKLTHSQNKEKKDDSQEEQIKNDWQAMLGREVRGLDSNYWKKYEKKVSSKSILGFTLHTSQSQTLQITYPLTLSTKNSQLTFSLNQFPEEPIRLSQHILLKTILNNLSTVIMGRMKRYQSNIMTYVRPTNYKLIDRATRYVRLLLAEEKWETTYQDVVKVIYHLKGQLREDQPIVLRVIEYIKNNNIGKTAQ